MNDFCAFRDAMVFDGRVRIVPDVERLVIGAIIKGVKPFAERFIHGVSTPVTSVPVFCEHGSTSSTVVIRTGSDVIVAVKTSFVKRFFIRDTVRVGTCPSIWKFVKSKVSMALLISKLNLAFNSS